jgi:exonuclease III
MIISSYNIRGLRGVVKRNAIKELIRKEKVDFLAIQETKMELISEAWCHNIWGSDDCQWVHFPAVGNNGGFLSIWSKSAASFIFSFSGDGFVGVCLEWGVHKKRCFIVNIYSKCDISGKRLLWENLLLVKNEYGRGAWCLLGDFNAVLDRNERRGLHQLGINSTSAELIEFRNFVSDMNLFDLPILGRRFTWFHSNGISMSRIDRVLISDDWVSDWGQPAVWVLSRSVSDHCPLVSRYNSDDWGPRPFRFNNHWLLHKGLSRSCRGVLEGVQCYWMDGLYP